jgi:hypothetical protein
MHAFIYIIATRKHASKERIEREREREREKVCIYKTKMQNILN